MLFETLLISCLTLAPAVLANGPPTSFQECHGHLKYPRPPLQYCGSQGTVASPKGVVEKWHLSYDQCRDTCLSAQPYVCGSFAYKLENGYCKMFSSRLQDMGYKSGWIRDMPRKYNRACFVKTCENKCSLSYDVTTDDHYLSDPNFENYAYGASEWWFNGNIKVLSDCTKAAHPYEGTKFVRIEADGDISTREHSINQVVAHSGYAWRADWTVRAVKAKGTGCKVTWNGSYLWNPLETDVGEYKVRGIGWFDATYFDSSAKYFNIAVTCPAGSAVTLDIDALNLKKG